MSDGLDRRTVMATFWAYVQNWTARGLSLAVFFVLARLLEPLDFGVFAIALVVLSLAEVLVEQGLGHSLVQRPEIEGLHLDTAFWSTLAVGVTLALGAVALAGPVAVAFDRLELAALLRSLSPVPLLMALASVPAALLRRELNYKVLAKRTATSNLISGIVAIACAASGAGVWTFVAQQLAFHLVGVVVLWRHEPWRPRRRFSPRHLRQLAGFSGKVTTGKLLEFAETRLVDLIVGRAIGLFALGQYSVAYRANQAVTQLLAAPLWESAVGALSRLQGDRRALLAAYLKLSDFSSLAIVPAFLFLAALAPSLIPTVLGGQWAGSVVAFQVLAVLSAVRVPVFLNGSLLQAGGMAGAALVLAMGRVALSMVALAALLRYGVAGATLALLVGQLLVMPLSFRFSSERFGVGAVAVLRGLWLPLVAIIAATAAVIAVRTVFARPSPFSELALEALSWSAAYVLTLLLLMPRAVADLARRFAGARRRPAAATLRPTLDDQP